MKSTGCSPKWRKLLIAATLAAVVVLGLLVTLALAQTELPPAGAQAFIQTSGPNTELFIGDWYTNSGQGNSPHRFALFVPCLIAPTSPLDVELFDPGIQPTGPTSLSIDEIRDAGHNITNTLADADDATFRLEAPDGSLVAEATYPPTSQDDAWVPFATFTRAFDCAPGQAGVVYTLRVSTSDNDDNDWRFRITHPDAIPGSGDEPYLATIETSYQHAGPAGATSCQDFYWYVNPGTTSLTLNNFDLDVPGYVPNATVDYFLPDGTSQAGTTSDNAVWNNGTASTRGGDVFTNPPTGWWQARVCVAPDNQYIFEPEGAYLLESPRVPVLALSHGTAACRLPGESQVIRYTIDFGNTSTDGAAFGPNLTFSLPAGTTFESCSGGLSCGETSPGSGVVTFSLAPVLPAGGVGQVFVDVRLGAGAPDLLSLTSTAELDYVDVFNNDYEPFVDTLTAEILPCAQGDLRISKDSDLSCYEPGESQTVNYAITYGNQGTAPAVDATVTDTLPGATTFVSCSGATCNETSPGVVVYQLGTLDPGATGSLGLAVQVDAGAAGSLRNWAQIEAVNLLVAVDTDVLDPCTEPPPEPTVVNIDIKPGSDPNSINCNNEKGVITVAILTIEDFDAAKVDHTTVTFEGASETHVDKKSGEPRRHEEDIDGDGDADLVFHFRTGDTDLICASTEGTLTGETFAGLIIEGTDAVRMID